ncbi:MAG: PilC/PilY family type IV pilus protein [Pseudomonas sp.]|uniref:pilus assembly protein n=1 Tax=Pseudomonas abieticivorans TaxID=2931382 RepID=UPI0020BF5415|nr:PilC/PilY family type IV pilus protein [Pseudomonas sp. PIA16]MDE1168126.1 PilC/PilY family type IV pilus protein [Pseudomonas sp.]
MPSGKTSSPRWLSALLGVLLLVYMGMPAFAAFTPSSGPLLSAAAVTPNVMLLVDDSGSMNSIIWDTGFDQTATQVQVYICNQTFFSNCSPSALDMTDTSIFLSDLNRGTCSSGYYAFYKGSLSTPLCLKLPDPVGSSNTRYSANYLAYLITKANGSNTDFTTGNIPNDYRINVARTVSKSLVASNTNLRIGLATFNPPTSRDSGPGGYIARAISDLQAVTGPTTASSTTAAQATTNYNNLISSINGLAAVANTPLAETYYEITRYFRGMTSYYNSSSLTYTSPIQYRCQKNFGVVITDGLPTYDRTFPTNDPLGGSNLPNWDKVNNDGNNLNGDSEGDTLYLDDIAKFAYDIDMRTAANGTDLTGTSWDATDFTKQNLLTYTVGFTASNDMLSAAASYGQGKYYQATDSASLSTALGSALSDITSKAGSGGGGSASSSTLTSSTYYYQTLYNPADWHGTVNAYAVSSTTGAISTTATLSTDKTLIPGSTTPLFESWNPDVSPAKSITMALGNFSPAQQTTLATGLPTGVTATQLVEWSKGTNATGLKTRTYLLGDVINSPLTLASPSDKTASDFTGNTSYTTYLTAKAKGMNASLIANANDGFTNVINPTDFSRRYAYMPSTALASLVKVADAGYINGNSHVFLNDGQINVSDAIVSGGWKTLALGGTGAGGKAFYAIQLYDATAGNTIKALWEIRAPATANTSNVYNDLGYAYARPEVARLPNGDWAAFIANGYGSNSGVASLYVVSLVDGSLITEIVVDKTETTNGLSSVKLKVDGNNIVQAAYAGDLKGRVWKFDLSSSSTSAWTTAFSGKPLFTAPGTTTQPITAQPLLVTNSTSGKMVYIGTGKFNETADRTTTDAQGFYAIWDADGGTGNYTVANLQAQSVTGLITSGTTQYLNTTENTVDYTTKKGWYLPIVYGTTLTGQRVIYQAIYSNGRIIFTTAGVTAADVCSTQGSGATFILDALSGSKLSYVVLDTSGDGLYNTSDTRTSGYLTTTGIPRINAIISFSATGASSGALTTTGAATQEMVGTDSSGNPINTGLGGPVGTATNGQRIMWRQIQ